MGSEVTAAPIRRAAYRKDDLLRVLRNEWRLARRDVERRPRRGGHRGRARSEFDRVGGRQRRHPHRHLLEPAHQRGRLVHLHGERRVRPGGARQAQLVHARLAAQRADQDGSEAVRHHLGGLSRIRLATSRSTCSPATARRRPTRCCAGARARSPSTRSTCRARRSTRISWTSAPRASATSRCGCRRAASASTRTA